MASTFTNDMVGAMWGERNAEENGSVGLVQGNALDEVIGLPHHKPHLEVERGTTGVPQRHQKKACRLLTNQVPDASKEKADPDN